MGTRFTEKAFRAEVDQLNRNLAESGSSIFYNVLPRNGHCAVDICHIDTFGKKKTLNNVEIGTPKECSDRVAQEAEQYFGKLFHQTSPSAVIATTVLKKYIDFSKEFSDLDDDSKRMIGNWMGHLGQSSEEDLYGILKGFKAELDNQENLLRQRDNDTAAGYQS